MKSQNDDFTMKLTTKQVWSLLRDEVLIGLDSGELTEKEFAYEMKTLRAVVSNSEFLLVAQPNVITNKDKNA